MSSIDIANIPAEKRRREQSVQARVSFRLASSASYTIILCIVYKSWLSVRFGYLGFPYTDPRWLILAIALLFTILPAALLPHTLKAPSDFLSWLIYYFIYVPCAIIPPMQGLLTDYGVLSLSGSVFLGMLAIIRFPHLKTNFIPIPKMNRRTFWILFSVSYIILSAYVWVVFRGHFAFAKMEDVYVQREAGGELLQGTLVGYATGILFGGFNAFLLALGVTQRRIGLFALGAAGDLLVYMTIAGKVVLVAVVLVPLVYYFTLRGSRGRSLRRVGIFSLLLCGLPYLVFRLPFITGGIASVNNMMMTMIYMRTLMTPGGLLGEYAHFFESNPHTLYSHINFVRLISPYPYPYAEPLGVIIGRYITGTTMDANANFFATDGVAALGNFGVILSGVFVGFTLRVIDSYIKPRTIVLFCSAAVAPVLLLANGSIFTTLLTGGLGVLVAIIAFWGEATSDGGWRGEPHRVAPKGASS